MQENSLQERTGQVSPEAQNPQDIDNQSLQQPTSNLQPTNDQLLSSPSNLEISVPESTTTRVSQNTGSQDSNNSAGSMINSSSLLMTAGIVVVFVIAVILTFNKRTNSKTKSEAISEPKTSEPVKVKVVSGTESTKHKTAKTKKKSSKRKKRSTKK